MIDRIACPLSNFSTGSVRGHTKNRVHTKKIVILSEAKDLLFAGTEHGRFVPFPNSSHYQLPGSQPGISRYTAT
jgi:hypothetical protein